jgi:hypothetical protein
MVLRRFAFFAGILLLSLILWGVNATDGHRTAKAPSAPPVPCALTIVLVEHSYRAVKGHWTRIGLGEHHRRRDVRTIVDAKLDDRAACTRYKVQMTERRPKRSTPLLRLEEIRGSDSVRLGSDAVRTGASPGARAAMTPGRAGT